MSDRKATGAASAAPSPVEETTVAALYVDPNGVYANLPGVEVWDEARDARLYDGPHPVVAHPPCARWSRLAGFTEARFGLKRGDDGGCFEAAFTAVRKWGGVLEHPAYTAAWGKYELPALEVAAREGGETRKWLNLVLEAYDALASRTEQAEKERDEEKDALAEELLAAEARADSLEQALADKTEALSATREHHPDCGICAAGLAWDREAAASQEKERA